MNPNNNNNKMSLTVVIDGVADYRVEYSSVVSVVILQENLYTQADHVQVIFFCLQQLLLRHCGHTHAQTHMHKNTKTLVTIGEQFQSTF